MSTKRARSPSPTTTGPQKRARSSSPSNTKSITSAPQIYHAPNPISDRSSAFRAAFIPLASTTTQPTSPTAAQSLQSLPAFSTATHRITATRTRGPQKTISGIGLLTLSHDDDGEKYGGKTLEKVLDAERVEGAVCVARWWGGEMLGPVRFRHMEEVARGAIEAWRDGTEGVEKRKRQAEEEEKERLRLVEVLEERDDSVDVLRKLLAEKTGGKNERGKRPSYGGMKVEVLRKLENVRDKTIEMLLRKMDEVEKEKV